jgi:Uma2 family endonuclease
MAIVEQLVSPEEYLKKEREGSREEYGKFEYFDGKLIEMGRASAINNDICTNLMGLLWFILRGKGYKIAHGDLRVANLLEKSYCYPDIVVVKGEYEFTDDQFDTILNPLLIIEVLSGSTQSKDRGEKFQVYRELASLQEYILVSQEAYLVERYLRQSDEQWFFTYQTDPEQKIVLESIQKEILLKDIYEGVKW